MNIIYKKIKELIPYVNNPRNNNNAIDKVASSIKNFGFKVPLVIDSSNEIITGHTRLLASKKLKLKEVPCVIADDLTDAQIKAYRIADNKVSEYSEWDNDLLNIEFEELKELDFDLELTGFDLDEIDLSMGEDKEVEEDDFDVDSALNDIVEPIAKRGDVYQLGEHRLMCGDSTSEDDVGKLMNGEKADMVFTDPPYGIDVVSNGTVGGTKTFGTVGGSGKVKVNKYSKIIGDETTETAEKFYNTCLSLDMNNFILWGGNYFTDFIPSRKCWIVWDKKGREWNDNFSDFEMAWTSFEKPAKIFTHVWMGMVQSGKREKRVHPTQKPSKLCNDCIEYLNKDAKNIYDGFGGSGSTLIACEESNRKCYMMELDEKYVDVIIKRYETLTGKQAELLERGENDGKGGKGEG